MRGRYEKITRKSTAGCTIAEDDFLIAVQLRHRKRKIRPFNNLTGSIFCNSLQRCLSRARSALPVHLSSAPLKNSCQRVQRSMRIFLQSVPARFPRSAPARSLQKSVCSAFLQQFLKFQVFHLHLPVLSDVFYLVMDFMDQVVVQLISCFIRAGFHSAGKPEGREKYRPPFPLC